jgi:asparagine synthase (glutamine-hydrolysing)
VCGIAGFIDSAGHDRSEASSRLRRMTDALAHRGPDSQGQWHAAEHGVALGHRRLAILELSEAGHQPMVSPSGRFVLVFNGEVYNHLDLRATLEAMTPGHPWAGHSDTETLLMAIEQWGLEGALREAQGMFALALWDRHDRSLALCRDRIGEKPLYYGWQGSGESAVFLFGSEVKAVAVHPAFRPKVCRQGLAEFMRLGCIPAPLSIHEGLKKVRPGFIVKVRPGSQETQEIAYWSLLEAAVRGSDQPFAGDTDEAVDTLETLLRDAVSRQMVADVPVGAFLSGGIDSSTIVALMQATSPGAVRTFSIGFEDGRHDESDYARAVAAHLGTRHVEWRVSAQDALDVIPRLPALFDEPFADASQVPTVLVSQLARRSVSVALTGDGGDELFAGYTRYRATAGAWNRIRATPRPLRLGLAWLLTRASPKQWNSLARTFHLSSKQSGFGLKVHKVARALGAADARELYSSLVSQWQEPGPIVLGAEVPRVPPTVLPGSFDVVEQMMLQDLAGYLPDDILTKVDRAAMSAGLETRVPFLDHRVVEFALSLPLNFKLRTVGGSSVTKWPLRKLLKRRLPAELFERPKQGFDVPLGDWLRGPLRDWAENLLDGSRLADQGYLDARRVRQAWQAHLDGRGDGEHRLWCVLMFQAWLDRLA